MKFLQYIVLFLISLNIYGQNTKLITDYTSTPDSINSPYSYKLKEFAQDLYFPTGQVNLYVVGDSINATNVPNRMHVGYRNQWDVAWNSWLVHTDSGSSDNGFINGQNALSNDIRVPGDMYNNGVLDLAPVRGRDLVYGAISNGLTLSDGALINSANFKLGNPFTSSLTLSLLYYQGPNSLTSFTLQGTRNLNTVSTVSGFSPQGSGLQSAHISVPVGSGFPGLRLINTGVTPSNNQLVILGVRYRNNNPNGVQFGHIAHGGWKITDHLLRYGSNTLKEYFDVGGYPTHIIIWLGQNQSTEESNSFGLGSGIVFQNNLDQLVQKYSTVTYNNTGTMPKILLVSQYQTGYFPKTHRLLARAEHNLSRKYPNVSFLNNYRVLGSENFDKNLYLSDGVHPNLLGSNWIASEMNKEMRASLGLIKLLRMEQGIN